MATELVVPPAGESITEVQVGEWLKEVGAFVAKDEPVVMLETDKANVDVTAPEGGVLTEIRIATGENAEVGSVLGVLDPAAQPSEPTPSAGGGESSNGAANPAEETASAPAASAEPVIMPAAQRALAETGAKVEDLTASGPGGRLLKEDVLSQKPKAQPVDSPSTPAPASGREEDVQPMTPLRRRVAERLVQAQQEAALLTTFNEVDMSAVMGLRKKYQDAFIKKYDIKLGFMSFFIKAAIESLKEFPAINAEIRDNKIVYKNFYDIGVAVGGGKGLVVPVLRDAHLMSFAELEKSIVSLAKRARENKLGVEDLQGGTFTITNGGIYGSMLSTPIVNPPQSGILGMHAIQERPIAVDGQVVIRPMMYLALTYDHRIVDGREAVTFLKGIKERIEDPARILIEA